MDILLILAKLFNARCASFRVRLFRKFRICLNTVHNFRQGRGNCGSICGSTKIFDLLQSI